MAVGPAAEVDASCRAHTTGNRTRGHGQRPVSQRGWRWASGLLAVAGLAFMVATLRADTQSLSWSLLPGVPVAMGLIALLVVSLLVSYGMWMLVLDTRPSWRSLAAYLIAQVAKYVPGGIWHGVGQVASHAATSPDVSVGATGVAYAMQSVAQVAAGSVFAILALALGVGDTPVARATVVLVVGLAVLLYRPWVQAAATFLSRRWPRGRAALVVPAQARILQVAALGTVTLALQGAVMAVLSTSDPQVAIRVVAAYGVAWAVGWLVLPLPAGLGLREFMLVALLPGLDPALLVAASLAMRVGQVIAEMLLVATSQVLVALAGD